jgi:hypothetical protein
VNNIKFPLTPLLLLGPAIFAGIETPPPEKTVELYEQWAEINTIRRVHCRSNVPVDLINYVEFFFYCDLQLNRKFDEKLLKSSRNKLFQ